MNRTAVLLCYNKEVLQYPNLQTWGPSVQSWLSCKLTEEKMRPTLVHNGAMTASVILLHIVCTEGRIIRQVFTKGIITLEWRKRDKDYWLLPNKATDSCTFVRRYNGLIYLNLVEFLKQINESDPHSDKMCRRYIALKINRHVDDKQ